MVPLSDITLADYQWAFDLNVRGVLFTVQKALPLMPDGAAIVINGSMAGSVGAHGMSLYSAAKAAVRPFCRCRLLELTHRHIRINCVSPGPIRTRAMGLIGGDQNAAVQAKLSESVPLGRMGRPEEVAAAMCFVASREAGFINGIELFVDGGAAQI